MAYAIPNTIEYDTTATTILSRIFITIFIFLLQEIAYTSITPATAKAPPIITNRNFKFGMYQTGLLFVFFKLKLFTVYNKLIIILKLNIISHIINIYIPYFSYLTSLLIKAIF